MAEKYKDSEIIIRQAKRADMIAVAEMILELANFEKMPDGPKLKIKDLERDCFDLQPPAFQCTVAEVEDPEPKVVGYAIYFPFYSTWVGRVLWLEDICVRQLERRRGVGERLFKAVAKEASSIGTRLDFHVLSWNPARNFYEARGAVNLSQREDWCLYRLEGDALKAAARDS